MSKERSRKQIARAALLIWSILLVIAVPIVILSDENAEDNSSFHFRIRTRSLSLSEDDTDDFDDNEITYNDNHVINEDSNFWKYAYVIVTYHKSGHLLSHHLTKYLQNNAAFHFGTRLQREVVQPRLQFDPIKKCTQLALKPGTITLLEAPQFHCKKEDLAMLFMKNPDKNNKSNKKIKFGVKLLHLVRNPFEMAVSNYHYHAQDPTPEPFVHTVNPCESLRQNNIGPANMNEVDLVQPKLAHPILPGMDPIMDFGAFGAITKDCQSLFRTRPGLEDASYYEHLRTLDPKEGLRLATADKFNHFALMASDLLVLEQVRKLVYERNVHRPAKHHEFALLTMSMEEWKESPERSMHRFLEFTFGKLMPDERKEYLAKRYGKQYLAKTILSEHVTEGKVGGESDKEELMEYLRGNAVFGGPLTRMEGLVNEMLRWQEAGYGIEG